jgi:choline-glycine betaine transporter
MFSDAPQIPIMTRVEILLLFWIPITVALLIASMFNAIEYILDLRRARMDKVSPEEMEVSWSNVRNEIGRLLAAQLFLLFGLNAILRFPETFIQIEFFAVALYKLWASVKDRAMRDMLALAVRREKEIARALREYEIERSSVAPAKDLLSD